MRIRLGSRNNVAGLPFASVGVTDIERNIESIIFYQREITILV